MGADLRGCRSLKAVLEEMARFLREEFFLSQFYGILVEKTPEDTTMAEMNQAQREEELARREALLAQREAQLEKEQAELAAAKAQSAERKKTLLDNNDPNFVNPKEKLYDKFPLTVHQMDIIIGVLFALILLFLVLGMTHTSFFGLFGG